MFKKILLFILFVVVGVIVAGAGYVFLRKPAMTPPSSIKVEITEARVSRGKYLFQNLCDCDGCHSERDFSRFAGPVVESGRGKGFTFPAELGMPGTVSAPNISPDQETGIGHWTDGEKIRAIREGVDRNGQALFPIMPYPYYRRMSDEDVYSMVAYMNILTPVWNALPKSRIDFPVSFFIKGVPQPVGSVPTPDRNNTLKYGEYLATLSLCVECHSPEEKGQLIESLRFAGGREFRFPTGSVVSANITPDPDTGIGKWSEQQFLDKFYQYREYVKNGPPKVGAESFTIMPWLGLSQLPPEELGDIFTYLKTQPPIRHSVEKHPERSKKGTS